jgi:hypothetical protein
VKNEDILFELIKFDMEQIRIYREAILYISLTCITGSFGVIAYALKRDSGIAGARRLWVIIVAQLGFALVLTVTALAYFDGLNESRSVLEMREAALRRWVTDPTVAISKSDIYPDIRHRDPNDPKSPPYVMQDPPTLEKRPIYVAIWILGFATAGVCLGVSRRVFRAGEGHSNPKGPGA